METTSVVLAIIGSGGVWAVVNTLITAIIKRTSEKAVTRDEFATHSRALRGLLYGELETRCGAYLRAGEITTDELSDLRKYYYEPYHELGGDGTIDALMARVEALPIRR